MLIMFFVVEYISVNLVMELMKVLREISVVR